ncbi:MAG: response regulator transcription factor [Bacteroidetes bacterium]|nr:response regulator transcription factor [Bacteroidota bacterium]
MMKERSDACIRIVIADDHPVVRSGLRMMIEHEKDLSIVGEAADGVQALAAIQETRPDVALIDIEMPGLTGLDLLREIRARQCETRCIILTLHDDAVVYRRAAEYGAMGYMLKDSAPRDILRGIRRVAAGDFYLGLSEAAEGRKDAHPRSAELLAVDSLTPSERRVLHLIAENKSTREIADELCVSPRTVDTHRANICAKVGEHGSYGLIRFAIEHRMYL